MDDETDQDADLAKHLQLSEEIRLAESADTAELQAAADRVTSETTLRLANSVNAHQPRGRSERAMLA
eukprot:896476-Rhodomonas_salina.1